MRKKIKLFTLTEYNVYNFSPDFILKIYLKKKRKSVLILNYLQPAASAQQSLLLQK